MILYSLLSCAQRPENGLEPIDALVRTSMTLRGVRPSLAAIDTIREDPDALPQMVDG